MSCTVQYSSYAFLRLERSLRRWRRTALRRRFVSASGNSRTEFGKPPPSDGIYLKVVSEFQETGYVQVVCGKRGAGAGQPGELDYFVDVPPSHVRVYENLLSPLSFKPNNFINQKTDMICSQNLFIIRFTFVDNWVGRIGDT